MNGRGKLVVALGGSVILLSAAGCAMQEKKAMETLDQPIDCNMAEGDIRVLQSEKRNVAEQIAQGVTAIAPAGIVMGILTGTESTKVKVAVGDYNTKIDQRIAQIKSTCGVQ
ncbi:MAG TPA: hypothetical protein VMI34_17680 [Candidatus Bathyarchaeia archaeon]|nr:hypothetical protein [Candidatus Bathyarchaeia archaeon]